MSPRTAQYVKAMIREGDNFDFNEWLKTVREDEAQAKQAQARATSGEFAASEPPSTPDGRPNPRLPLATKTVRVPRTLRPHREPTRKTPSARLRQWLEKIQRAWDEFQTSRARDAVYAYLAAVFAIVMHYKVRRRTNRLLRHAFKFADRPFEENADSFKAVIRCTSDRDIDNKTVSKYARALRYAARRKEPDMRLKTFMKEAGGVNACADLYAKHFGRGHTVSRLKLR
jgi:hypothetical protein